MVKSFEDWAKTIGLKEFFLLVHGYKAISDSIIQSDSTVIICFSLYSMGAFLVSAHALQHPDQVLHLVLADPLGFPDPSGLTLW